MKLRNATVHVVDTDCAAHSSVQSLVAPMGIGGRRFASAEEFLESYQGDTPGCLVTELRLPGMSGMQLLDLLRRRGMPLPVIVVTEYADVPAAVEAMQLGAMTVLEKPCRDLVLWEQIRNALTLEERMRQLRQRRSEQRARLESLTPQERQIMDLICAGEPNKTIASQLDVSLRTVEARRKEIYRKLGTSSLAALVRLSCEAEQSQSPQLPPELALLQGGAQTEDRHAHLKHRPLHFPKKNNTDREP